MSEPDRITADQAPSLEPLGIKEPLRSPTALGQSKFLMPLGLRSLSVLQPIAVHPQGDDFDFSSIQAAEPTDFQGSEPPPSLQLSSLPELRNAEGDLFEIPESDRPPKTNNHQPQVATPPKSHPGTSLPRPVKGVVQFFKSVLGRQDSPTPEKTSAPESPSRANSLQPLSDVPSLIQPQWDDANLSELPQVTTAPEPALPSFVSNPYSVIQQRLGSNLDIQRQAEDLRGEKPNIQAAIQQLPVSNLETQQRAENEAINFAEDTISPVVGQSLLPKNATSSAVDSQPLVADYSEAIAPTTQFNLENAPGLRPQKISSENFQIPASDTIQLHQEDALEQEPLSSFLQERVSLENSISSLEITVPDTGLATSARKKDVDVSKVETVEFSKIQRQPVEQSIIPVQPISSTEIPPNIEPAIQLASSNEQAIQPEDNALINQDLSVIQVENDNLKGQDRPAIQRKNDERINQDRPSAIASIFPLLNDVEKTNALPAKREDSLEQISCSLETGAAEQYESSVQSPFPISPATGESGGIIQQRPDMPVETRIEAAIGFVSEIAEPQEITQPSLPLRKEPLSVETSDSFLESTDSIKSITPVLPQIQRADAWVETTSANHQLSSSVEETEAVETPPATRPNLDDEPTILQRKSLQRKSAAADSLSNHPVTHDASTLSHGVSSSDRHNVSAYSHNTSSTHDNDTSSISHDVSLTHHNASPIKTNHNAFLDEQESLVGHASSSPDVLQLHPAISSQLQDSQDSGLEIENITVPLEFTELETRSPQDSHKGSPLSANTAIAEKLSSSVIQRDSENSVSETQVVLENSSDIESENHLEHKAVSGSVNDSSALIESSMPDSLQMKSEQFSEQSDELAIDSNHQNLSATESFNPHPKTSIESSHPGSEIQRFPANVFDTPSQFTSDIPAVPVASISVNEAPADTAFVEEGISESVPSLPDSIAQPFTELAIASVTSEPIINSVSDNSFPRSNNPESLEVADPLADPTPSSSVNIHRRIEPSPVEQNPTLPSNVRLRAEADLDSTFQSVAEQNSNLQRSFSVNQQRPSQDLQPNTLDLGRVDLPSEQLTDREIRSPLPPHIPTPENSTPSTIQRQIEDDESESHTSSEDFPSIQLERHSEGESHHPESFPLLKSPPSLRPSHPERSNHPGSDIQRFAESSPDHLDQSTAVVPTIQAASTSSIDADKTQENAISVEVNNSESLESSSDAHSFVDTAIASSETKTPIALSASSKLESSDIAQQQYDSSPNSFPSENGFEEKSFTSNPVENLAPFLAKSGESEFDIAIQQRLIGNADLPTQLSESETLLQLLPNISTTENLPSSTIEQQSESLETIPSPVLESSPDIQLDSEGHLDDESLSVESLISYPTQSSSLTHPGSDIQRFTDQHFTEQNFTGQRFTDSTTISEYENAVPQSSPDIQLDLESHSSVEERSSETLNELPLRSSSEAIAPPFSKSAIAFPSPSISPPSHPIANTWDASSSYDSTPNGRRDAQVAASENHLPVESAISPVLPNSLSSDIQRFVDNSSEHSSPSTQLDSSDQSEAVTPTSFEASTELPQLPRFLKDLTVLKPLVQRSPLNATPGSIYADVLNDLPLRSSSEAIAPPLSESAIAFPSPSISPPSQPIANTWDASSSYESTPNGRRDAQVSASENHLLVESAISPVLPNSLSSDIQRFVDNSSEHSSPSAQLDSSGQSEAVTSTSFEASTELPQLPRFLKDLTVLKPLVQRSPLNAIPDEFPDKLPIELADHSIPPSFQNSFHTFPSSHNENQNSAIYTQQSSNIQPALISAPTPAPATAPAHPGTAPSAWSSLAELINPKPAQPQQNVSENYYSPLAPSLIQAKFATPTQQKATDPNVPIEVLNAPTTTLSSDDFQQEAHLDKLLETLAQEIYSLLRQKMEIERERQGRNLGRMPW